MKQFQKFYPHALALVGFVLVSLIYFYPVLSGKQIFQSDIAQYTGMAKEQNDFRAAENAEPYWTNSAFGGMPTYQLGAKYPHDYIGGLDDLLRFLPRPADYLMLYFFGFYLLLIVLRTNPLKAFFGALAFGLSTYLVIILGVGHNAKAHAIAYMPMVVAGVILVFRRRYITGGLLTMVAAALEINANHFQMTYYLLILLLVLSIYFVGGLVKEKNVRAVGYSMLTFAIAGVLAIGANATNIMATQEYAKWSTRDKSELTFNADGSPNVSQNAMSHEYITEYSYGVAESLDLIAPRLFGGSNSENVGTDSQMYQFMISQGVPDAQAQDFVTGMPTYWGDQPIVAAPAYIGAVVFFLCVLCLFVDNRKIKYAFLAGAVISLMLSWGKNFPSLTNFFIEFVPMYNKFRAVSSIQVILELCIPVLAVMGLQSFFAPVEDATPANRQKLLLRTVATCLGIVVLLLLFKGSFSFAGPSDAVFLQNYGPAFVDALKEDRKSLYSADLLRTGFFFAATAGLLWLYLKNTLKRNTALILIGVFMVADLFFVAKRYVAADDFVSASEVDVPFVQTQADAMILADTTHYRVFEVDGNLSSARASYFHKSLGGYHAAKPRRMQQLFDYQIAKNNMEIIDMLNIKYIIQTDSTGAQFPTLNPNANGNAWFVKQIRMAATADAEMRALDKLDTKNVAVVNQSEFGSMVKKTLFQKDSLAALSVVRYKPNYLKYQSRNANDGIAVFSEMYYGNGWNAYIDGKKADHFRANYALRGLYVPAGNHTIEFKFEPEVVARGGTIALVSSIGMLLLIVGGLYMERRKLWYKQQP